MIFQKLHHQSIHSFLHVLLRLVIHVTEIHHFILWLVEITYHVDQLTHNVERLLHILLYKIDHACFEVLLQNIKVSVIQAHALHIIDTLD